MEAAEEAAARDCAEAYRAHGWIARSHLVDFLVHDLWANVPETWRSALLALNTEELTALPTTTCVSHEWPEDLQQLVRAAQRCTREAAMGVDGECRTAGGYNFLLYNTVNASGKTKPCGGGSPTSKPRADTSSIYEPWLFSGVPNERNMGPKKKHEVCLLAPTVAALAAACGSRTVVDVGSGLGYLSTVLAFHYGLNVIGLEASISNARSAARRARAIAIRLGPKEAFEAERARVAAAHRSTQLTKSSRSKRVGVSPAEVASALPDAPSSAATPFERGTSSEPSFDVNGGSASVAVRGQCEGGVFHSVAVRVPSGGTNLGWLLRVIAPFCAERWVVDDRGWAVPGVTRSGVREGAPSGCGADSDKSLCPPCGTSSRVILVGLHTCGDLGPSLLRMFGEATAIGVRTPTTLPNTAALPEKVTSVSAEDHTSQGSTSQCAAYMRPESLNGAPSDPQLVGLISLGCCYHLLSEPGGTGGGSTLTDPVAASGDGTSLDEGANMKAELEGLSQGKVFAASKPSEESKPLVGESVPRSTSLTGFPMSNASGSLCFGEAALGLAVHAVERRSPPHTSAEETRRRLRGYFFRSALEKWLQEESQAAPIDGARAGCHTDLPRALPRGSHSNVGPMPHCDTFEQYAMLALGKLGRLTAAEVAAPCAQADVDRVSRPSGGSATSLSATMLPAGSSLPDRLRNFYAPLAAREQTMHAFDALRSLFSPIIERIVLYDRLMYLRSLGTRDEIETVSNTTQTLNANQSVLGNFPGQEETRVASIMFPLFDPLVSPRGTAIIACVRG